ncbi:hypothetical protein [Mucilaginibacter sp. PAMB04168]|uniref:hypothetical protein n=1 Tax=Mucilaginibacter sp. PAMB04168 TaxID=3138567 RepID=UPI0033239231
MQFYIFDIVLVMMAVTRKVAFLFLLTIPSLIDCRKFNHTEEAISVVSTPLAQGDTTAFKNLLGVNAFEWNFLQNPADVNNGMQIYEPKMQVIKTFAGVRHYLDWGRIESKQGQFTFSPTHSGGWNLDAMYQRCKTENIDVLVCLKTCPDWLLQTYPGNERDAENVPMPYGSDKLQPKSYVLQAKAGFQFAARYGSNLNVEKALLTVNTTPRWTGDQANEVKTGLGLIKYIECDNERDKWWKGDKAHQSAEEYAANLSAFYDGHKGTLGKGVGVKNADPKMQVVMAGLAATDAQYVAKMIDWCKQNRGYKTDGSVNLCFDVINFHLYSNDHQSNNGKATQGIAPELSEAGKVAADFVTLAQTYKLPVWVTEAGYDINQQSPQRAVKVGNKDELKTQADWTIRTSLLYARFGIKKVFFYELFDDNLANPTQYASSGLVTNDLKRRPAADYILQTKNLLGNYSYRETISKTPLVDVYRNGNKVIYVLTIPDQTGKNVAYNLSLPGVKQVTVHQLHAGTDAMESHQQSVGNNTVALTVTETPLFVEVNK